MPFSYEAYFLGADAFVDVVRLFFAGRTRPGEGRTYTCGAGTTRAGTAEAPGTTGLLACRPVIASLTGSGRMLAASGRTVTSAMLRITVVGGT